MNENENGTPEVPTGDTETPPPTEQYEDGTLGIFDTESGATFADRASVTEELNRLARIIKNNNKLLVSKDERILALRTEQIWGDDPRLADFWEKAQRLADNANYCQVFDEMAEALGGPSRIREYEVVVSGIVTVPWSITVTVEAKDDNEALEYAEQMVQDNYRDSDMEDHADWYEATDMDVRDSEVA